MILLVLFIVFMVLWLASIMPAAPNPISPYGGIFAWISVLLLSLMTHALRWA